MNKTILAIGLVSTLAACTGDDELASVNGSDISKESFDAYLSYKRVQVRDDTHRQKTLDDFLSREALADIAAKELEKNGGVDAAVIQAEINDLRNEVLINRYFETYLKDKVTDQAISNYYNQHAEQFSENKVHVAHILIRTAPNMDDSVKQVKRTLAQEAFSKIQSGMAFEEAVEKYSEDNVSKKKGGDLGWLKQGAVAKPFSDAAFSLEQGKVSEPIETEFGFHILTVLEMPVVTKKPYESVKGEIRYRLRGQAKVAETERLLELVRIEKY